MTPPPSIAEIQRAISDHEPDLYKYVYSADEIGGCTNLYESVKEWGRTLHTAGVDNSRYISEKFAMESSLPIVQS